MIVFNATEKLLQDIAREQGVRLVIATDYPAEMADEREQEFIGKWFSPAPSDSISAEVDLMYGCATPPPISDYDAWLAAEKAYAHEPTVSNRAARMQAWKKVHPTASPYNFSERK